MTTDFFVIHSLAPRYAVEYVRHVPQNPPSDSQVKLITAAVATGSIGGLVALTKMDIFSLLPGWAAVMIVVVELVIPFAVFRFLRRAQGRR